MQLPPVSQIPKRALDAYLLREPERIAKGRSALQQESIARYHAAAMRRVRVARDLRHSETLAALVLYREAATLLLTAIGQAETEEALVPAETVGEAWRLFDGYPRSEAHEKNPDGWDTARAILASDDLLSPDALPPEQLRVAAATCEEAVTWLASFIEPRTPVEIRFTRVVRVLLVPALAIFVPFVLHAAVALSRKNLALAMPATASSQRPYTPAAGGVNNGILEPNFGVHTNIEPNPWVKIDLGASVPVHEVRVFNRGDGYESEILPLTLQIADDEGAFSNVGDRVDEFTRDSPWIVKLDGKHARYIRVLMPREGYIALTEIEVY